MERILEGGIANAGQVTEEDGLVRRPSRKNQATLDRFLAGLHAAGFTATPHSRGRDDRGRETYPFIPGEAPIPPYPAWAQTDTALVSVAQLLRRFHDAAGMVGVIDGDWDTGLADPHGGSIICHNDLCPENTIFVDGQAAAMIDFDYAAPGSHLWDVAATARMWIHAAVPPEDRMDGALDPRRFGVFAKAYGVAPAEAEDLVDTLFLRDDVGFSWVRAQVEAGEPAFVEMWEAAGGLERRSEERPWLERNRSLLIDAVS